MKKARLDLFNYSLFTQKNAKAAVGVLRMEQDAQHCMIVDSSSLLSTLLNVICITENIDTTVFHA